MDALSERKVDSSCCLMGVITQLAIGGLEWGSLMTGKWPDESGVNAGGFLNASSLQLT